MTNGENKIVRELVKFVEEQKEINQEHKEIHREFARAMIETNRRQEALIQRLDKSMIDSEKRFRMYYARG